jgi:hypothetical protein
MGSVHLALLAAMWYDNTAGQPANVRVSPRGLPEPWDMCCIFASTSPFGLSSACGAAIQKRSLRMRKINWVKRHIPKYVLMPVLGCLAMNMLVYYGSRLFNLSMASYDLSLPLDHRIPLIPPFIVIYVLSFVYWWLSYVTIGSESPRMCGILFGEMIAKVICLAFFLLLPTSMERPEVTGNDIFSWMVRFIYFSDVPNNLFPSIHCMESHLCWRGLAKCSRVPKWVKIAAVVLSLTIYASTLFVRQHLLVDIPAGILVGEIGLWISRRLRLGERYAKRWEAPHEA